MADLGLDVAHADGVSIINEPSESPLAMTEDCPVRVLDLLA